jgi:hypothetical protein
LRKPAAAVRLIAQPIGDVIKHRADGARRKGASHDAQQQHRIRALHHVSVDQVGHVRTNAVCTLRDSSSAAAESIAPLRGVPSSPTAKQGCGRCVAKLLVYALFMQPAITSDFTCTLG